jgi:hypothetical protein
MFRLTEFSRLIQNPQTALRLARLGLLAVGLLALAAGVGAPECPGADAGC